MSDERHKTQLSTRSHATEIGVIWSDIFTSARTEMDAQNTMHKASYYMACFGIRYTCLQLSIPHKLTQNCYPTALPVHEPHITPNGQRQPQQLHVSAPALHNTTHS
jgi:hypothetical protein